MPEITQIKPLRSAKDRVSLHLDGRYYASFQAETLIRAGLSVGSRVDEETLDALTRADEPAAAYERSLNFLQYRARSAQEMATYLKGKGYAPQVVSDTVERLRRNGLLDDAAFGGMLLRERKRQGGYGRAMVKQQLKGKGLESELVDQLLEQDYSEQEELASAAAYAQRMLRRYADREQRQRQQAASQALARRGYSWSVIREALARAGEEMDFDD
ncbi:MAG: regulatory protein RecX [Christensenellales bacterium]|jgi:regulatory protein